MLNPQASSGRTWIKMMQFTKEMTSAACGRPHEATDEQLAFYRGLCLRIRFYLENVIHWIEQEEVRRAVIAQAESFTREEGDECRG